MCEATVERDGPDRDSRADGHEDLRAGADADTRVDTGTRAGAHTIADTRADTLTRSEARGDTKLDEVVELGDEIASLAAHIHAATARLLERIARFDRKRGWKMGGHRSCAHWLSFRTGIDLGAAREKVRTARALEGLPETRASMAERALAVGLEAGLDPAVAASPETARAPISGTRAERYQVMLHVERATLDAEAGPGRSELEDGTRVSAETSRRLACDAAVVRVERSEDGAVLDVGRRTRTIPPALRRALEVRDRGCRFPGCGLRFTDAHHVRHWAEGGRTSLDNCLLLCRFHHRLVHEEGWSVGVSSTGDPVFLDPRGGSHLPASIGGAADAANAPESARPARDLVRRNRARGVDPGAHTASARWTSDADIPDEIYFGALEASAVSASAVSGSA